MTLLSLKVLLWLLAMPLCAADKPAELDSERGARFERIALTIAFAAEEYPGKESDTAAMLMALAWHESRLCRNVHSGKRKGGHGEGLWQLEPGSRRTRPFSGLSYSETLNAARQAAWLVRHSYSCGPSPAERFTQLAFGRCGPETRVLAWGAIEGERRQATYASALWALRKVEQ